MLSQPDHHRLKNERLSVLLKAPLFDLASCLTTALLEQDHGDVGGCVSSRTVQKRINPRGKDAEGQVDE